MRKHINFLFAPGTHYFALDCFETILVYFIDEYENDSRFVDEITLAHRLLDFVRSDNLEYFNA